MFQKRTVSNGSGFLNVKNHPCVPPMYSGQHRHSLPRLPLPDASRDLSSSLAGTSAGTAYNLWGRLLRRAQSFRQAPPTRWVYIGLCPRRLRLRPLLGIRIRLIPLPRGKRGGIGTKDGPSVVREVQRQAEVAKEGPEESEIVRPSLVSSSEELARLSSSVSLNMFVPSSE